MSRATSLADLYRASVQEYTKTPAEWNGGSNFPPIVQDRGRTIQIKFFDRERDRKSVV